MTVKQYKSGLTVTVETDKSLRSVTAGIAVGAGSAYETPEDNGLSHFIEHMLFKGTDKRSAADIVREFDEAGAAYNAFTGKEYTCFYFKSIDENTEACFDVLSDLFLNSVFDEKELERERKVILEEINMSKDEPDGVCYDVLYRHIFDGSLGMEILGPKANVKRFNKSDITRYKSSHYLPSNTVVAFVGNITAEAACALVEKHLKPLTVGVFTTPPEYTFQPFNARYGEYIHDYEQSEISIAYPALRFDDKKRATLSALDCIIGNGMSSRMFQRIREKMGLCYSVYSTPRMGKTCGEFTVCANVSAHNAADCVKAIKDEISTVLKDGVTERETEKAKTQLKVAALFGKENPMNYMLSVIRWRLFAGKDYDIDELLDQVNAITAGDINALAREIFAREPAMAYVGKKLDAPLNEVR